MSTYRWTNSYTRILDDGTSSFQDKQKKMDEVSLAKSENYLTEKKNRRPVDQNKLYTKFVNEVFRERTIISQKDFNVLISKRFNSSTTWYRKRMITLGLIVESHRTIRKSINSHEQN